MTLTLHLHCLFSCTTQLCEVVTVTWLGVSVVHSVAIQLEELHRLGLLLSVAAHGKGVLTHLDQTTREEMLTYQPAQEGIQ